MSCFLGPGDWVWTEGPWGPQAVRGGEGSGGGGDQEHKHLGMQTLGGWWAADRLL